jgi:predicted transcriptional regulator
MIRVDEPGSAQIIVGEVSEHLIETLRVIYEAGSITNADLAARLGLNHTACNNRATKLFKLGLIHRRKNTAAPGGRQYSYEGIA